MALVGGLPSPAGVPVRLRRAWRSAWTAAARAGRRRGGRVGWAGGSPGGGGTGGCCIATLVAVLLATSVSLLVVVLSGWRGAEGWGGGAADAALAAAAGRPTQADGGGGDGGGGGSAGGSSGGGGDRALSAAAVTHASGGGQLATWAAALVAAAVATPPPRKLQPWEIPTPPWRSTTDGTTFHPGPGGEGEERCYLIGATPPGDAAGRAAAAAAAAAAGADGDNGPDAYWAINSRALCVVGPVCFGGGHLERMVTFTRSVSCHAVDATGARLPPPADGRPPLLADPAACAKLRARRVTSMFGHSAVAEDPAAWFAAAAAEYPPRGPREHTFRWHDSLAVIAPKYEYTSNICHFGRAWQFSLHVLRHLVKYVHPEGLDSRGVAAMAATAVRDSEFDARGGGAGAATVRQVTSGDATAGVAVAGADDAGTVVDEDPPEAPGTYDAPPPVPPPEVELRFRSGLQWAGAWKQGLREATLGAISAEAGTSVSYGKVRLDPRSHFQCFRRAVLLGAEGAVDAFQFLNDTPVVTAAELGADAHVPRVPREALAFRETVYRYAGLPSQLADSSKLRVHPQAVAATTAADSGDATAAAPGVSRAAMPPPPRTGGDAAADGGADVIRLALPPRSISYLLRAPRSRRRLNVYGERSLRTMLLRLADEYHWKYTTTSFSGAQPLAAQVAAVRGTGVAVGVHGANLVNAQFLPAGGALFELFPFRYVRFYYMAGGNAGLRYSYHTATHGVERDCATDSWCFLHYRESILQLTPADMEAVEARLRGAMEWVERLWQAFPDGWVVLSGRGADYHFPPLPPFRRPAS